MIEAPTPTTTGKTPLAALVLALVGMLIALATWSWWQLRSQHTAIETLTQQREGEAKRLASTDQKLNQLADLIQKGQQQLDALDSRYADTLANPDERVLFEVDHNLYLAQQQIYLAERIPTALHLLKQAAARLSRLTHPRYLPLQQALQRDIVTLAAWPVDDAGGLSLRLQQLFDDINSLPLAAMVDPPRRFEQQFRSKSKAAAGRPSAPPPLTTNGNSHLSRLRLAASEAWQRISESFALYLRIREVNTNLPVALTPDQAFFLRENVKLHLMSARLAVISRNWGSAESELRFAETWLRRYFDLDDAGVRTVLNQINALLPGLTRTAERREAPSLLHAQAALDELRRQTRAGRRP